MRKTLFVLVLTFVCLAFAVSCEDEGPSATTSLEIVFRSDSARTILPPDSLMEVRKYSVSGNGPNGASFGPFVTSESSMTLQDISLGKWTITASALNVQNNELAFGSASCEIVRGHNEVALVLDDVKGSGTLEVAFSWESDICGGATMELVVGLEDGNGVVTRRTKVVNVSDCTSKFALGLSSGSYIMTVNVLQDGKDLGLGATEAVRIISNTKSSGSVVIRGKAASEQGSDNGEPTSQPGNDPQASLQVSIDIRMANPMNCFIDYSPKAPTVGQKIVLNAMYVSLPYGVASKDLFYQWYRDGEIIQLGYAANLQTTVLKGVHRYDVVVKSPVEGTLCSATMVLNTP